MHQGQFELEVFVHGHPIREYPHEGQTFVEGRCGSEYKLHVRNHSPSRVLAVITVDGLSVMDGSDGDARGDGYVLDPHSNLCIPGWRLDNGSVAKFAFGGKGRSYAAQTGRPHNIGVIGCAIYEERPRPEPAVIYRDRYIYTDPWPYRPWRPWGPPPPLPYRPYEVTCTSGNLTATNCSFTDAAVLNACSLETGTGNVNADSAEVSAQTLGTEFGRREDHAVVNVTFDRKDSPVAMLELYYDDRNGLLRRGIDLRGRPKVARPSAFPRGGGCQPPSGWRGYG